MLHFLLRFVTRKPRDLNWPLLLPLLLGLVSLGLGMLPFSHWATARFANRPEIIVSAYSSCGLDNYVSVTPLEPDKLLLRFSRKPGVSNGTGASGGTAGAHKQENPLGCFYARISAESPEDDFRIVSRKIVLPLDASKLTQDGEGEIVRDGVMIDDMNQPDHFEVDDSMMLNHAEFMQRYGDDCQEFFGEGGSGQPSIGANPTFVADIAGRCAIGNADDTDFIAPESKYSMLMNNRYMNYGDHQEGYDAARGRFNKAMASYFREINALPIQDMQVELVVQCPKCLTAINGDLLLTLRLHPEIYPEMFTNARVVLPKVDQYAASLGKPVLTKTTEEFGKDYLFNISFAKQYGFFGKDFFLLLSSVLVGFGLALIAETLILVTHKIYDRGHSKPNRKALHWRQRLNKPHIRSHRSRRRK